MFQALKHRNFYVMLPGDISLMVAAYYLAYYLRFDGDIPQQELSNFLKTVIWTVPLKVICFYYFGLYRGMWRYTSIQDMKNLTKACLVSTGMIVGILLLAVRFVGFPRSIFPIDLILTFMLTGAIRIGIRLYFHREKPVTVASIFGRSRNEDNLKCIIIVGAGDAGDKVLRELKENPALRYKVVGFIDNDPRKKGRALHDVPILGNVRLLPSVVKQYEVEEVFIAAPSATGEEMRTIVEACESCDVVFKTLPGLGELIDGKVSVNALREVRYEDLLGRPIVKLDIKGIEGYLKKKNVMVTGAGGSIGSELCRQLCRFNPEMLVLVDASEENLYRIQRELKDRFGYINYVPVLGNIQAFSLVDRVFQTYNPEVVFHAAAYKHVPMLEKNPWEAVFNNILGTRVVLEQSLRYKVNPFVLISTDKAVRPSSVMGASKRVCEMMLNSFAGDGNRFMAVRFGNVTGSSGSVIPLFRAQIARGGPVTVTHPEITRFFMTIPEAAQLILQTGGLGTGGEIFILEMGTPVKILDMAQDLIRLSGKEPHKDIEIVFTGLRPGEKLHEELITEGEGIFPTEHKGIMVLRSHPSEIRKTKAFHGVKRSEVRDQRSEGGGQRTEVVGQEGYREWLNKGIEELIELAKNQDGHGIQAKLKELVPEYTPQDSKCVL